MPTAKKKATAAFGAGVDIQLTAPKLVRCQAMFNRCLLGTVMLAISGFAGWCGACKRAPAPKPTPLNDRPTGIDVTPPAASNQGFPGGTWSVVTPAEAAMDENGLKELAGFIGGAGCVTRNGKMVYTWGLPHERTDLASAGKPVITFLLLKAVEDSLLPSVDSLVASVEPRLTHLNAALGYKDRAITWRHLANQTACYGVTEAPGAAFDDSDYQTALLFDTLLEKVYRSSSWTMTEKLLHPKLTRALTCEDAPEFIPPHDEQPHGRVRMSPRDFCRFGLLFLHEGQWAGTQILGREFVRLALSERPPSTLPRTKGNPAEMLPEQRTYGAGSNQEEHLGSYSWCWWVNGKSAQGERLWPAGPDDAFGAVGYGGNRAMFVLPQLGVVMAWTKSKLPIATFHESGRERINRALGILMPAIKELSSQKAEGAR